MPRILRVIARLNVGGPARQVVYLHEALQSGGWEDVLVHGRLDRGEGDFGPHLTRRDSAVFLPHLVRPISPLPDLRATLALYRLLGRRPFDLVHTHTAKAGFVGRAAALLHNRTRPGRRVRLVHTFHGHVLAGYFGGRTEAWIKRVERFLWTRTDRVVTLTRGLADEIRGHLGTDAGRVAVVPLGLDLAPLLAVERRDVFSRRFGRQADLWIGWTGRLVEIKNPGRFLDLAAALSARLGPRAAFVLVGDGHLRAALEARVRASGLAGTVFFTGWEEDLAAVYAGMDLFCNTSDNEGTPVAVLEALTAGVPVAAADVGGTREVLPAAEGAWAFPPDGWQGLLEAWAAFLAAPRRLPDHLRRAVAASHSRERLLDDLKRVYGEVLG